MELRFAFDMVVVMNDLDRFHLVADVVDRVPAKLIEHKQYIAKHGENLPEIRNWKWDANK